MGWLMQLQRTRRKAQRVPASFIAYCGQADLNEVATKVFNLSAAGIGNAQLPMNAVAIAAGGGVRVGLEDNIWYDSARSRLATNKDLIRRIHRIAETNERTVMKPVDLRNRLALGNGHGKYGRMPG